MNVEILLHPLSILQCNLKAHLNKESNWVASSLPSPLSHVDDIAFAQNESTLASCRTHCQYYT